MAEIVVFHHALGLTRGIAAFAGGLREAGHTVHTPDLYEGRTFASLGEGVAHLEAIGFAEVLVPAARAVEDLPAELVYAGISLGAAPAQRLTQTRDGARGVVLVSACLPHTEFGASWPSSVPVQIHAMEADPEFDNGWDLPAARALVDDAADGELFLYPGDRHLFADPSLPAYDSDAAASLRRRVLDSLAAR